MLEKAGKITNAKFAFQVVTDVVNEWDEVDENGLLHWQIELLVVFLHIL